MSTNGLSKSNIFSIQNIQTDKLQAYISKIQSIQNADLSKLNPDKKDVYQSLQIKQYANALSELKPTQAAVLLSTQGLTNAQIQQTLAAKGLSTEMQYQAKAIDNYETAKQEQITKLLEYSELYFNNTAEKYKNIEEEFNNTIDEYNNSLETTRVGTVSAKSKNEILDKITAKYKSIVANNEEEIKAYQSKISDSRNSISSISRGR